MVTSNRRLHRIAAFTAASVLFGITSTVSALASQQDVVQAAPVAVVTNLTATEDATPTAVAAQRYSAATHPATVVRAKATPKVVAKKTVVKAKATSRATSLTKAATHSATRTSSASAHVRTISSYVDAPGSQKAIDSCKLVLWTHSPLWLAGHNWCGWQWMAYVPTGSTVKVTKGAAAGTYVVTGHKRLSRQSGSLPSVHADLVLQTCVGSGTALTLLRRL